MRRRKHPSLQAASFCSDLAIELVLTLRLVFHLALRQADAFAASVLRLFGCELPNPDRTIRPGRAAASRAGNSVSRRKLHPAMDAVTSGIAAGVPTNGMAGDAAQAPALLG